MSVPFESIFNQLQYASSVKAKQILRDLEGRPTDLEQFCRQARRLSPVRAASLSNMLVGLSNPEFLQLLKEYVLSENEELSRTAFFALSKCNNSARKEMMFELLKVEDASIRQQACEVLGADLERKADSEIESNLAKLLDDAVVNVVISALKVLSNSIRVGVIKKCEGLLSHPDEKVRFFALGIVANSQDSDFALDKVAKVLEEDDEKNNRIEACRLLSRNAPEKAKKYFIDILNDTSNLTILRQQSVQALAQLKSFEVAEIFFNIIVKDEHCVGVVMECRKALGKFHVESILRLVDRVFAKGSVLEKFEGARILGIFANSATENYLEKQLYHQDNQLVLSVILEQLAKAGVLSIWEFALLEVANKKQKVLAYAAAQALAELLTPDRVVEFAKLLQHNPIPMIAETILQRLAVFGRDRGLPATLTDILRPYLKKRFSSLTFFALEVAGYVENSELVLQMLGMVDEYIGSDLMDDLTRSILQGVNGSLHKLLIISGDAYLTQLAAVLSRLDRELVVEDLSEFFIYLSRKAEAKTKGAQLCLTICATLLADDYVTALSTVGDKELAYLLYTWSTLPDNMRDNSAVDWGLVLGNPKIAVRVAALRALTESDLENHIADVADLAFSDPRIEGREAAATALRELFNAE